MWSICTSIQKRFFQDIKQIYNIIDITNIIGNKETIFAQGTPAPKFYKIEALE